MSEPQLNLDKLIEQLYRLRKFRKDEEYFLHVPIVKNTMPRPLQLTRTEADFLIDLLEEIKPQSPHWRYTMAEELRKMWGYPTAEEASRLLAETQRIYDDLTSTEPRTFRLKTITWDQAAIRWAENYDRLPWWQKIFINFRLWFGRK